MVCGIIIWRQNRSYATSLLLGLLCSFLLFYGCKPNLENTPLSNITLDEINKEAKKVVCTSTSSLQSEGFANEFKKYFNGKKVLLTMKVYRVSANTYKKEYGKYELQFENSSIAAISPYCSLDASYFMPKMNVFIDDEIAKTLKENIDTVTFEGIITRIYFSLGKRPESIDIFPAVIKKINGTVIGASK